MKCKALNELFKNVVKIKYFEANYDFWRFFALEFFNVLERSQKVLTCDSNGKISS